MFATIKLKPKRWMLMRQFRCHDIRYYAEQIGAAMANEDGDNNRNYCRSKIHDNIQRICAKNNIGDEDLSLIEEDLNDYINGLVRAAYVEETKKLNMREAVDSRIKIKRVDGPGLAGDLPASES